MPIKFRCLHCRQFLGISRSRAGAVVDCPTCGRSVRVPSSDGKVEPLPAPRLNLKDSALASALDELAMIGREPIGTQLDDDEPDAPDREAARPENRAATIPAPAPLPEPIPIEPPLPAERIEPASAAAKSADDHALTAAVTVQPSGPEKELVPGRKAAPFSDGNSVSPFGRRTIRSLLTLPILLPVAVFGIGGFLAGYAVGVRGRSPSEPSVVQDRSSGKKSSDKGEALPGGVAVTGRVTYRTAGGDSRPDVGARVIVLPEQRTGTAKLSVVGLRPADVDADFRLARAGLRALGGDVASVDAQGSFSIGLLRAGTYHILILSHHQARDNADETGDRAAVQTVLEAYFDRPRSLLGRLQFHLDVLRYSGSGAQLRDHTFERQP